jgi:DNA replication and repair protein RecF
VNTVGPHRDDLVLVIEGREARTHASQGEQRCLALALRLAVHRLVCARTPLRPTLLLDDVFSELDPGRSRALVEELPAGQSIVTTAVPLPVGMEVARVVQVGDLVEPGP